MKNNIKKSVKRWLALVMTAIMVFAMATTVMATSTPNNIATDSGSEGTTTVSVGNSAPSTGSITVDATSGTYMYYKIALAAVETGDDTYTYTVDSIYESIFAEVFGASWTWEDVASATSTELKSLATKLETYVTDANNNVSGTQIAYTASDLELGYYLIIETGNTNALESSQPMLVAVPQVYNNEWSYSITATPKKSGTDFTKKIAESGSLVDTSTANIGDYVEYRLYADIPTYETAAYTDSNTTLTFKITDTMSSGLTWGDNSTVSVYVVDSGTTESTIATLTSLSAIDNTSNQYYELTTPTANTAGGTFTVTFTKAFLSEFKGKVVIVAFSAQLNENAVIANATGEELSGYDSGLKDTDYNETGNPNGATLEYSNSYYGGTTTDKIKDMVTTFTFKLDVEKVDADVTSTLLAGAEFKIYTDAACTTEYKTPKYENPLVSSAFGVVTATGLKEATYYLKETKAPSGYSLYDGVITVEIVAGTDGSGNYTGEYSYTVTMGSGTPSSSLTKVTVEDEKGLTMPGTGGIGTTIFTFGGLALVIIAAIMFIVYTKKQRKQA